MVEWCRSMGRQPSISLILCLLNFPLCTSVHLGSVCSLPTLLSHTPRKIIANPAARTPKSGPKDVVLCFKISTEGTCVPEAASHYKNGRITFSEKRTLPRSQVEAGSISTQFGGVTTLLYSLIRMRMIIQCYVSGTIIAVRLVSALPLRLAIW